MPIGEDGDTEFVGRAAELERLAAVVEQATHGRGSLLVVSGPAGIGKTALLSEAAARCVGRITTSFVTAGRWSADAPLLPWARTLRSLVRSGLLDRGDTQGLVDELLGTARRPVEAARDHLVLLDHVVEAVLRAATARPVAIFLDDLHRADPAVLHVLGFLADELASVPIALVGAYRIGSGDSAVADLIVEAQQRHGHLPLGGLDAVELAALARRRLGGAHDGDELRRRTNGNPLHALQWAEHHVDVADLGSLISDRLGRADEPTRRLLAAAVVLGHDPDAPTAAALAGLDARRAGDGIRDAVDRGLVLRAGGAMAFVHDLVPETLYASLSRTEVVELHRRAIDVLARSASTGVDRTAELARHVVAGDIRDAAASERLVSAARTAEATGAPDQAVVWWRAALDRVDPERDDAATRASLQWSLARAQARAGDRAGSRATILRAADDAMPDLELVVRTLLEADNHNSASHVDVDIVQRLADLLDCPLEPATRVLIQARLARWLTFTEHPLLDRMVLADAARADIGVVSAPRDRAKALYHLGVASAGTVPAEERHSLVGDAVRAAREANDPELELQAGTLEVGRLLEAGLGHAYRGAVEQYAADIERTGALQWRWHASLLRSTVASLDGRFDDAERWLDEALSVGKRFGHHDLETVHAACLGGHLAMRGLFGDIVDAIAEQAVRYREFPIAVCALPLALVDAGRDDEARLELDRILATGVCDRPTDYTWLVAVWALGLTAAAVGDTAQRALIRMALEPFSLSVARMSREGMGCAGVVPYALGAMAEADGDLESARAWYEQAVRVAGRLVAPVLAADAEFALARVLSRQGRQRAAASLAERARAAASATGVDLPLHRPPSSGDVTRRPLVTAGITDGSMIRDGGSWRLTFRDVEVLVPHIVGLDHLAVLLGRPTRAVDVVDLAGGARDQMEPDVGPQLDDTARKAYRRRIEAIHQQLDRADARGDASGSAALQDELEMLVRQLSGAVGLGGRARPAGSGSERARFAVTKALRTAIRRIAAVHPELGDHLDRSIRTGRECCYTADNVSWRVERSGSP